MAPETYRLYLDQMFGIQLALALQAAGFDVMRASAAGQSRANDAQILRKAIDEKRVLITLDGHFGDWVVLPFWESSRSDQAKSESCHDTECPGPSCSIPPMSPRRRIRGPSCHRFGETHQMDSHGMKLQRYDSESKALLGMFLRDGIIYVASPGGNLFGHRASDALCREFRKGLLRIFL